MCSSFDGPSTCLFDEGQSLYDADEGGIAGQIGFASGTSTGEPSGTVNGGGLTANATPIPVVLNDGTVVQNPRTGSALLQPAGVSLAENAKHR